MIAFFVSGALGVPGPVVLIQAAVFGVADEKVETGWPHPCEPKFPDAWKAHFVTPIGKRQHPPQVAGGDEIAVACAAVDKLLSPISFKNDVGMEEAYWHFTALTNVPSTDGVNVRVAPFQIPRTVLPLSALPAFCVKVLVVICLAAFSAR